MASGQDRDSESISCITSTTVTDRYGKFYVYTGHKNGEVRMHRLNLTNHSDQIDVVPMRPLSRYGEPHPVTFLKTLSNPRLFSYGYDERTGHQSGRIWTPSECSSFPLDFGSITFYNGILEDVAELPNNLLAVTGNNSMAYGCFHVFDTNSRESIHERKGSIHRPHGMSLTATAFGYLAFLGHCAGGLSTWKVTAEECTEMDTTSSQGASSMVALPTGEIVLGGFRVQMYQVEPNGKLNLVKTFYNRNVIYEMYPTGGYGLVTVDSGGGHSGILRSWNLLDDAPGEDDQLPRNSFDSVADIFGLQRDYNGRTTLIPRAKAVIYALNTEVQGRRALKGLALSDPTYEILKNARILSQAKRVDENSGFGRLPTEILLKIIVLSGLNDQVDWEFGNRLANVFYGRRV